MSYGVCFDCYVRLRKNEGNYIRAYQLYGPPLKVRICDVCKIRRDEEYKNKYAKRQK